MSLLADFMVVNNDLNKSSAFDLLRRVDTSSTHD